MLKRVAIAKFFIGQPKLVILDEPTAGLDPYTANLVKALVKQQQNHITFIISSHNIDDIEDLCQQVLVLKSGIAILNLGMRKIWAWL